MHDQIGRAVQEAAEHMVLKRYSNSTQKTYLFFLKDFFYRFQEVNPNDLGDDHVHQYLLQIIRKGCSSSTQNQAVNALKFYFEKVLGRDRKLYRLQRPRKETKLPTVLSSDEVRRLLEYTPNLKHKALLSLIYACGLRIGEVLDLRLRDISKTDQVIHIKEAKGKKDRIVPLSPKLLELLRTYYRDYKPLTYLFEGQKGKGTQYSGKSAQQVLKRSLKRARIRKKATLHTLRHSYATHLLMAGTNLRMIQKLLGHNSSKTTEIYTHITDVQIAQVVSPFDKIA
ncbi:MAG: tyrosine-type recombinase/integrase [Saprospiraceae bacterium]|nr:tyrosine-type recombinase/integrase [Saprospiraceae bacterium]